MDDTKAAVTGPNFHDTPIRLANAKVTDTVMKTMPQARGQTKLDSTLSSVPMNRATSNDQRPDLNADKNTRVVIVDPPTKSLVEGNKFVVALKIQSTNETQFRKSYIDNKEGRICLSLDRSPFVCWPPHGRMFFTQATEGEHEIVAALWRNGVLEESTTSEKVTFTTILNPTIVQESHGMVESQQESLEYNRNTVQQVREALNQTNNTTVNVIYPIVQIASPQMKVSYTGTSIPFESVLPIINDNDSMFEKYFQTAFVCINVDIATAFSCFPIFGSNQTQSNNNDAIVPWVVGLSKGMHTVEAMLSHPETGDLLPASSSGTVMFFMAGDQNEGAAFIGSINIRGQRYEIPIMQGGCLEAQTRSFCSHIGLSDVKACVDPVLGHLKEVAVQVGFVSISC